MNNRPFYSTNTNVYDQSVFSSAPTNFNGQNVLISQEQQRKMFDTLNTSIMGLPYDNSHQMSHCPGNFIQAQRQFIPGGVMFSFNLPPQPQNNPQTQGFLSQQISCCPPSPCPPSPMNCYPTTLEQQITASGVQKHGLETLQFQQQLAANPFQLKFHFDTGTSCSDLLYGGTQIPGSKSTPDFSNVGGVLQSQSYLRQQCSCQCEIPEPPVNQLISAETQFPLPPIDVSRNIKRLTLSKPPNKFEGHVIDLVDIENDSTKQDDTKKRVCFADECQVKTEKADKSEQALLGCTCNAQNNFECKPVSKKDKSKTKKKTKEKDTESCSDSEDDASRTSKKKSNKKYNKKSNKQSDSQYFSTEDSELSCLD